jgi:hypothetical protein
MHNLAYKIEPAHETVAPESESNNIECGVRCAACGEALFGDNAPAVLCQAWRAFWEISGTNSVELVCGACGEYLHKIFND